MNMSNMFVCDVCALVWMCVCVCACPSCGVNLRHNSLDLLLEGWCSRIGNVGHHWQKVRGMHEKKNHTSNKVAIRMTIKMKMHVDRNSLSWSRSADAADSYIDIQYHHAPKLWNSFFVGTFFLFCGLLYKWRCRSSLSHSFFWEHSFVFWGMGL